MAHVIIDVHLRKLTKAKSDCDDGGIAKYLKRASDRAISGEASGLLGNAYEFISLKDAVGHPVSMVAGKKWRASCSGDLRAVPLTRTASITTVIRNE